MIRMLLSSSLQRRQQLKHQSWKQQLWIVGSLLLLLVIADGSAESASATDEDVCGLYLAESSTSTVEDPKWGVYTGKGYLEKDPVGYSDVAINLIHLVAHNAQEHEDETVTTLAEASIEFLEEYIWVPQPSAGQYELDRGRLVTAMPGIGVLGGFNPKLTNTGWNQSAAWFRQAWGEMPEASHPGRGASSSFFNAQVSARTAIPAGMEIFVDYGESWEEEHQTDDDEEEEDGTSSAITQEDYTKIDETVEKMIEFFEKHQDELDEAGKLNIYSFISKDIVGAAVGAKKGKKISNLLPLTPDELYKVREAGGSLAYSAPESYRSVPWLKENGRCMDAIRPGPSTIRGAGRGAFATRAIPEGGLISPMPLLHIPDGSMLDMFELEWSVPDQSGDSVEAEEESLRRVSDDVIGHQLLMNYCLGHPESNMLFFPTGAVGSLINHSLEKANAKLVWSKHPGHNAHWFNVPPMHLLEDEYRHLGLLMEVVATRDIAPDEEIFLDYGPEWAEAWSEHVDLWEAGIAAGEIPATWPKRALDLNQEYRHAEHLKPFKTRDELETDPYPEDVSVYCFILVKNPEPGVSPSDDVKHGVALRQWADEDGEAFDGDHLIPCEIIRRSTLHSSKGHMTFEYTIEWTDDNGDITWVQKVPHKAIVFVDNPETSDVFVPQAFRHYIGIPDDIFPQGPWRDFTGIEIDEEEEEADEDYEEEDEEEEDEDEEEEDEEEEDEDEEGEEEENDYDDEDEYEEDEYEEEEEQKK